MDFEPNIESVVDVVVASLIQEIERITGVPYELKLDVDRVREVAQHSESLNELCDLEIDGDIATISINEDHEFFKSR